MTKGKQSRRGIGISLYLPEEMLRDLRAEAYKHERSLSWVVAHWWRRMRKEREG